MKQIFGFSILLFAFLSCTAQQPVKELRFPNGKLLLILDSAQAAQRITVDYHDHYFELINPSEMSIQMKKPLPEQPNRTEILPAFLEFLRSDMGNFTPEESKFTADVMEKIHKTVAEVAPDIFPDTLLIIKTKGKHYGDGVYYTRDNLIIVPANELAARKTNPFSTTMYHELFHVYSRLHPAKRIQLYKLIGFEEIGLAKLRLPDALAQRVLYNPDGVDFAQKIDLSLNDSSKISAIPIIYAKNPGFITGNPEFFSYLEFNLFQITPNADGSWQVLTKDDGFSSVLDMQKLPDFFKQIKDNTGYIIHPDEVLADNFSFIMVERNGSKISMRFSPEGKQLLKDMEAILRSN